jgi:hypothetical protein
MGIVESYSSRRTRRRFCTRTQLNLNLLPLSNERNPNTLSFDLNSSESSESEDEEDQTELLHAIPSRTSKANFQKTQNSKSYKDEEWIDTSKKKLEENVSA